MNKTIKMNRVVMMLLVSVLSTLTAWAGVGDMFAVDGLYFTITSESPYTVELSMNPNLDEKPEGDVIIPPSVTYGEIEYAVTGIGLQALAYCRQMTSVSIPSTVEYIGSLAFDSSPKIESIVLPDNLKTIGSSAFTGCSKLQSLIIPSSVTSIDGNIVSGCRNLSSLVVEFGNPKYDSRDNCNAIIETATNTLIAGCKDSFFPDGVDKIANYAFYYCTNLQSIIIPASISKISDYAFSGCSGLKEVVISNGIIEIGKQSFDRCTSLTSLVIPASVEKIGYNAFFGCKGLTTVTIGSGLKVVQYDAFKGCTNVTDIYCYANAKNLEWEMGGSFNSETGSRLHIHDFYAWANIQPPFFGLYEDLKVDLNVDIDAGLVKLAEVKGFPAIFKREFQEGVSSTICLPFSFTPDESIGEFYEFSGVNDERTEVTMTKATAPLTANKPYLFKPAADGEITFEGSIDTTNGLAGTSNDDFCYWTFTGTYAEKRWDAQNNTDEIGRIYGFASGQGYEGTAASTEAGAFIRVNSGGIKPFRAYLEYTGSQAQASSARRRASSGLPERMTVRLIDSTGQTTGISTLSTQTVSEWFDMSGRKLNTKPERKGMYINNGHKVVIK